MRKRVRVSMAEEDLISMILGHWGFWVVAILGMVYLILNLYMKNKGRPEQQPNWGAIWRAKVIGEKTKKKMMVWGAKMKGKTLTFGMRPVGIINAYGIDHKKTIKKKKVDGKWIDVEEVDKDFITIQFRNFGAYARLKAIFGKWEHIIIEKDSLKNNDKHVIIDPLVSIVEDSGVWTRSRQDENIFIDNVNLRNDVENVKGFASDFPRRLSNLDPHHSMVGDTLETHAGLEDRSKEKKRKFWERG